MRARSGPVIATLLLALAAWAEAPDASVPAARPGTDCPSATQAEERARQALREPQPPIAQPYSGPLSPPLPAAWPPTGEPAARFYAFRSMPLPTGIIAYRYWSPHAAIQVPLRGGAPKLLPLKARVLGRGDDTPAKESSASVERAADALLQALCRAEVPSGEEAEAIRAGYQAWLSSQPLVAKELRAHAPAFFMWLDATGAAER